MGKGRPNPEVDVPVNVPAYTKFQSLSNVEFLQSTRRYRQIKEEMDRLEAEKKALSTFLQAMMTVAEQKAVAVDNLVCTFVESTGAGKLNIQRLVECGVEADLIAACTDPGEPYTYVQVTKAKGAK